MQKKVRSLMTRPLTINRPWHWRSLTPVRLCFLTLLAIFTGCATFVAPTTLCPQCKAQRVLGSTPLPIEVLFNSPQGINQPQRTNDQTLLHVYLEGDGRNWWMNRLPPSNPSSTQLTALKLMMADPYSAAYLQRPCFGQKKLPVACEKTLWTSGRYSNTIITQMNLALDAIQTSSPNRQIVLIGHSGGGSIAMILASLRQDVRTVITLGANLDHQAWTNTLGYTPLSTSLNAVDVSLPPSTLRWHYAAPNDETVPWQLTQQAARQDPKALFYLLSEGDHICCWQTLWPGVLHQLHRALIKPN